MNEYGRGEGVDRRMSGRKRREEESGLASNMFQQTIVYVLYMCVRLTVRDFPDVCL